MNWRPWSTVSLWMLRNKNIEPWVIIKKKQFLWISIFGFWIRVPPQSLLRFNPFSCKSLNRKKKKPCCNLVIAPLCLTSKILTQYGKKKKSRWYYSSFFFVVVILDNFSLITWVSVSVSFFFFFNQPGWFFFFLKKKWFATN